MRRITANKWLEQVEFAEYFFDTNNDSWEYCVIEGERTWVLFQDGSVKFAHTKARLVFSSAQNETDYDSIFKDAKCKWQEEAREKNEQVKEEILSCYDAWIGDSH